MYFSKNPKYYFFVHKLKFWVTGGWKLDYYLLIYMNNIKFLKVLLRENKETCAGQVNSRQLLQSPEGFWTLASAHLRQRANQHDTISSYMLHRSDDRRCNMQIIQEN